MTYFHNHIRDLINDNATFTTDINIDRATTYGTESFVAFAPLSTLSLRADYTHTIARDDILDTELLRRPATKASLNGTWQPDAALTLSATVVYTGPWMDDNRAFTVPPFPTAGYATTNIAASYALSPKLAFFARINNLFDRRYEEPVGFQRPGFGVFAGIKAAL